MNDVLVTGGAGFIGSNLIRAMQTARPEVTIVNLDALTYAGSIENLRDLPHADRHIFVEGNICDEPLLRRLLRDHDIDTVVNLAAESHVDRSIDGPAPFIETNVVGTFRLLEAARAHRVKRFHHVSTDEVFGSLRPDDPAFSEQSAYLPSSPYSASKASSDHLVRAYWHTYRVPVTISNCSNNYGPYQFPEKLIPLVILNALAGEPLPIYGDGKQVRDWLYVKDHCEGILAVLDRGQLGETYNFGGGNQPTNLEVVEAICALLDEARPDPDGRRYARLIELVPDRPGHDRRYAIDSDKAHARLGWAPRHSLDQGLRATVEWYAANSQWIEAVREDSDHAVWLERNYGRRSSPPD